MADNQRFSEVWEFLQEKAEARGNRLASELEAAWAELASMLDAQAAAFEQESTAVTDGSIASLQHLIRGAGNRLLFEMIRSYRKVRPHERALAALESYEAGLEDLVRRLPQNVAVPGQELVEVLRLGSSSRLRRYMLHRRRAPVQLPVRRIVERRLLLEASSRAKGDGAYFLMLAKGSLLLLSPWQQLPMGETQRHWLERFKPLETGAREALTQITNRVSGVSGRLAGGLLRGEASISPRRRQRLLRNWRSCFRYWSRQQRAVGAVLELEYELTQVFSELVEASEQALRSVDQEQAGLLAELDKVIQWLQEAQTGSACQSFRRPRPNSFPPRTAP